MLLFQDQKAFSRVDPNRHSWLWQTIAHHSFWPAPLVSLCSLKQEGKYLKSESYTAIINMLK